MLKHLSTITLFAALGLAGCSSTGVPTDAAPASGPSSTASQSLAGGTQLGVTGDGGVLSTAGVDVVSPILGDGGLLGATLAGGSNGLLGSVASGAGGSSPLPSDGLSALDGVLTQVSSAAPQLGISGEGGLGQDLLGYDVVGGLIGTDGALVPTVLGGGDQATLGAIAPGGNTPLQPVGDLLSGVVEGAKSSATSGSVNALSPVLQPLLLSALGASGATGTVPLPIDLPIPELPIAQLQPVLSPTIALVNGLETTPLPGGQTAGDVVIPVVLGSVLGIAGNTLPLDTVTNVLVPQLP